MGEETVWLTQQQMADLFQRDQSVIARHIRNIYKEEELPKEGAYAKFAYMGHDRFLIIDDVPYLFGASQRYDVKGKRYFEKVPMNSGSTIHHLALSDDNHTFIYQAE